MAQDRQIKKDLLASYSKSTLWALNMHLATKHKLTEDNGSTADIYAHSLKQEVLKTLTHHAAIPLDIHTAQCI